MKVSTMPHHMTTFTSFSKFGLKYNFLKSINFGKKELIFKILNDD